MARVERRPPVARVPPSPLSEVVLEPPMRLERPGPPVAPRPQRSVGPRNSRKRDWGLTFFFYRI